MIIDPAIQEMILRDLRLCSESSGCVNNEFVSRIARQPGKDTDRQHAAYVSQILREMEGRGLIKRADDQYPILWQVAVRDD